MRFGGASRDQIVSWGEFLNYSITWDDAERVFTRLSIDQAVSSAVSELFRVHPELSERVVALVTQV